MSALELLLAGLPDAGKAGDVAELLARLAVARAPQRVSLWVRAGSGLVQVRVGASSPTRPFREDEAGAYVRDLMALHDMPVLWGHSYRSASDRSSWWAQLGGVDRAGGAR